MRRRASPVQQWVDSLPSPIKSSSSGPSHNLESIVTSNSNNNNRSPIVASSSSAIIDNDNKENNYVVNNNSNDSNMTISTTPIAVPSSPAISYTPNVSRLVRDPSFQSDSSHCSSVESLLELRRADPEEILLSLGFGGCPNSPQDGGPLARIPKRFLQPSKLKGIAIDDFVRHQQEANESLDSTSLGYRGLTGHRKLSLQFYNFLMIVKGEDGDFKGCVWPEIRVRRWEREVRAECPIETAKKSSALRTQWPRSPYVAPSEIVQKIMQRLREHESHELDVYISSQNNLNNGYGVEQSSSSGNSYLPQQQDYSRLSVLSPDNRQYLERPRSKSPDMRNKRMIIGQRSFAFGRDGDLIEINAQQSSQESDDVFEFTETIDHRPRLDDDCETMGPTITTCTTTEAQNLSTTDDTKHKRSLIKSSDDSTETIVSSKPNQNAKSIDSRTLDWEEEEEDEAPRRASEGSNDNKPTSATADEEGRRHSDSVLLKSKTSSSSRKRSLRLKRQAKIRETPHDEGIGSLLTEETLDSYGRRSRRRCAHCGRPEIEDYSETDEKREVMDEDDEDSSCCYKRTAGRSCWREMEKVLQKNKKLEDTVAESQREMSVIKDMLSNVLSVRMEPGF